MYLLLSNSQVRPMMTILATSYVPYSPSLYCRITVLLGVTVKNGVGG